MISFIKGEIDLEKAVELAKLHTRQYAKRQLTWFRKNKETIWLDIQEGIEKMAPTIGNATGTIAKNIAQGITSGIKEGTNNIDKKD